MQCKKKEGSDKNLLPFKMFKAKIPQTALNPLAVKYSLAVNHSGGFLNGLMFIFSRKELYLHIARNQKVDCISSL